MTDQPQIIEVWITDGTIINIADGDSTIRIQMPDHHSAKRAAEVLEESKEVRWV